MPAVRVINLGKRYKHYPIRWNRLLEWGSGGRITRYREFWAFRGVSFDVESGGALGVIGQNGAGKSTLLKVLTGTTKPTEGVFEISGRVAAILELGMGFHPDFTGYENALMGLQVLGLSSSEISAALPRVVNFSELRQFIDHPLRTYSSGMHVRLAFSVATAIRPDVLIVDEALSVGDAYFQHKSMQRIREFKELGTTLLFVSHDPGAVKSLCDRAILLDEGVKVKEGTPDSVLDYYNAIISRREKNAEVRQIEEMTGRLVTRSGDGRATIRRIEMSGPDGNPARAFRVGDRVMIDCLIEFSDRLDRPTVGILIRDRLGNDVFGTNTFYLGTQPFSPGPGEWLSVRFEVKLDLGYGNYSISVSVHAGRSHLEGNHDWWDQALAFQILPGPGPEFIGNAALGCQAAWRKAGPLT